MEPSRFAMAWLPAVVGPLPGWLRGHVHVIDDRSNAMERSSSSPAVTSQVFNTRLEAWFKAMQPTSVSLRVEFEPVADRHDDYAVVYEAFFEPVGLDQARAELWLTAEGKVAVGLETRRRVAERVGVRTLTHGFAAGHEPKFIHEAAVFKLLELVAAGRIIITAGTGLWVLGATRAAVSAEGRGELVSAGYQHLQWMAEFPKRSLFNWTQAVRFNPWRPREGVEGMLASP